MENKVLLSLCIPTNGIKEWVYAVLESIYNQGADNEKFEVVVTDNGNNQEFYDWITEYARLHDNLRYFKTQSYMFLNEIDCYKKANGVFIKFLNHRTMMLPGALGKIIDFVEVNQSSKPSVYFSNGVLKFNGVKVLKDFDSYVRELSYWSSWSTGMAFWKEDFDKFVNNISYNTLFPHTDILFHEKNKETYIVNNEVLLKELPTKGVAKGKYDLFYAFAIEYLSIIQALMQDNYVTISTFLKIKNDNLSFLAGLYVDYFLLKRKCSYDLSSFKSAVKVYYSVGKVKRRVFWVFNRRAFVKIFKRR